MNLPLTPSSRRGNVGAARPLCPGHPLRSLRSASPSLRERDGLPHTPRAWAGLKPAPTVRCALCAKGILKSVLFGFDD